VDSFTTSMWMASWPVAPLASDEIEDTANLDWKLSP
jgi:hypothetical protein